VLIPGIAGLLTAAVGIGIGVGLITPIGFAHLAATTPTERLGQTMGSAEVGRELGDAGGPLLVGALGAAITLTPALLAFAGILTVTAGLVAAPNRRAPHPASPTNPASSPRFANNSAPKGSATKRQSPNSKPK
jgi:MFS family permease